VSIPTPDPSDKRRCLRRGNTIPGLTHCLSFIASACLLVDDVPQATSEMGQTLPGQNSSHPSHVSYAPRLCEKAKMLSRDRTSYSFEVVLVAYIASSVKLSIQSENTILATLRLFEFSHSLPPIADLLLHSSETTLCAKSRLIHRSNHHRHDK
jgi:hypothetical protein